LPYSLENSRLITLCRTSLANSDRARKLKQKLCAAAKAEAAAGGGGGVKKAAADADYKKKRRQPLSEEALANRRAAAQKAAIARKLNPAPVTQRRQVRVHMRFDSGLCKGGPSPKMIAPSSGRLVDVGSAAHRAAQRRESLGLYHYWM
jgi:hypothetical protein